MCSYRRLEACHSASPVSPVLPAAPLSAGVGDTSAEPRLSSQLSPGVNMMFVVAAGDSGSALFVDRPGGSSGR